VLSCMLGTLELIDGRLAGMGHAPGAVGYRTDRLLPVIFVFFVETGYGARRELQGLVVGQRRLGRSYGVLGSAGLPLSSPHSLL
jgi:hypothetical protein